MESTSSAFKENARRALADPQLQRAMGHVKEGFIARRTRAADRLPEFEALRDQATAIKDHVLAHLDLYLERYEAKVVEMGGQVHWARDAEEARRIVLDLCRRFGARTVTKGKTMIAEEIALNDFLEENGIEPVETDLGEYIIQLRREPPSHIIAPAVHLTKEQVAESFRAAHRDLPPDRPLDEPRTLLAEARARLRRRFLAADVGITGANFLIAETGSSVIVTNEGNGDLTQTLPRAHIVLASLEKVVPTLEDATTILRLLARSATGQEMSVYTTFSTGPRRPEDSDGPGEYHVVLLDNGRSAMLGTEFQDMLRCIRCGACLNHCPVYAAVGGHAYGWVYPGPMGAVLTPTLIGIDKAGHLPNASTFCGRCESVCPMRIPLPKMMRHWRERAFPLRQDPPAARRGLALWAWAAKRPALYRLGARIGVALLAAAGRRRGAFRSLPLAGAGRRGATCRRRRAVPSRTSGPAGRAGERMSDSRSAILRKVKQSLGRTEGSQGERRAVEERIATHERNLVPARSAGDAAARTALFVAMAEEASATVARVAHLGEVAPAIAFYLRRENLPAELAAAPDPLLDRCGWEKEPILSLKRGPTRGDDEVSVTGAFAAVAETGTLMLLSGPDSPTTLNFLPETHIVVLPESRICGPFEDAWDRLRAARGQAGMPRTVNFVTGPSRSADIEQKLQMGAHGPRRLHIVLVAGAADDGPPD